MKNEELGRALLNLGKKLGKGILIAGVAAVGMHAIRKFSNTVLEGTVTGVSQSAREVWQIVRRK